MYVCYEQNNTGQFLLWGYSNDTVFITEIGPTEAWLLVPGTEDDEFEPHDDWPFISWVPHDGTTRDVLSGERTYRR